LPFYKDLQLDRYGVRYLMPPVQSVAPFSDGRCLILHADMDKTCKNIAYFSQKDAKAYRELFERFDRMREKVLVPEMYAPPVPFAEKKALLERFSLGREYLEVNERLPRDLVEGYFESDQLKAMIHFLCTVKTFIMDEPGVGYVVPMSIAGGVKSALCVGGSHDLAHGLAKVIEANGSKLWEASHVRQIIVEGGRATGVVLDDGRAIRAEKVVVSAVDPQQTFLDLVGQHLLESSFCEKIRNYEYSKHVLFSVHAALNEPLRYTSEKFDPDINMALNYAIGYECVEDFDTHWREIAEGMPPKKPGMQCASPTLHDPTQAPPGKHTIFSWQFSPYNLKDGGPEKWDEIKNEYMEACLERWRHYAPNLDSKNIIAKWAMSPLDLERKMIDMREGDFSVGAIKRNQMYENRPVPGLAPYRTPIDGLYMCGSCTHPHGLITGGPGYNAAGVILDDLKMNKWWNPVDPKQLWEKESD
jgi:phytoene dehydrogenase-like protein